MPTVIGLIFFVTAAFVFLQDDDKLFALLIFSAIFPASSVVALNGAGIEPYFLVGALFVLQCICRGTIGTREETPFKGKRWMILFAVIAILSAFTLPFIFAGIPVYDPHVGIDDGLFLRPPLHFAHANIFAFCFIALGSSGRAWRFSELQGPNLLEENI
jgi:quinol-cytochrome oxidoreductase complex cytochrome b subunit